MPELGRIELAIGAIRGHQIINGQESHLPVGSTLKDGVFYWGAGPGFLGHTNFDLNGRTVPLRQFTSTSNRRRQPRRRAN